MARKPWQADEVATLQRLYAGTLTADLARMLGRTTKQVSCKAHKLGLRKTREFIVETARARTQQFGHGGAAYRFRAGLVPWNKGRPFDAGGRSVDTRFRAGNRPQTWVPIGSRRVNSDGVLDRKITDTGYAPRDWRAVHRMVWEAAHGDVPPGHVVVFRPGRRTTVEADITLDAVELVSRAELMRRNSVHRLPREVAQAVQLIGAVNRQINERKAQPATP